MSMDPVETNPAHYRVVFEKELPAGLGGWLPAQRHGGENIGDSPTHVIFVELKENAGGGPTATALGPDV